MTQANITIHDVHEAQQLVSQLRLSYWQQHVVGSFQWWIVISFTMIVALLWWKTLQPRKSVASILFASLSLVFIMFLDTIGGDLQLWEYGSMVLPWGARLVCVDIDLAMIYAIVYELVRKWNWFAAVSGIIALVCAYVLEPLSQLLGIYYTYGWRHIYSVPFYFAIPLLFKYVTDGIMRGRH